MCCRPTSSLYTLLCNGVVDKKRRETRSCIFEFPTNMIIGAQTFNYALQFPQNERYPDTNCVLLSALVNNKLCAI